MKLKISLIGIVLALAACSGEIQAGNTETRIRFDKFAVATNITGELNGFEQEKEYVIAVGDNQTLTISQVNAGQQRITLNIVDPIGEDVTDMDAGCNGNKTVTPTVKGDYKIKVFECMKAEPWNGNFTLSVRVE